VLVMKVSEGATERMNCWGGRNTAKKRWRGGGGKMGRCGRTKGEKGAKTVWLGGG